jgi:pilus assembly protein CpaB
MNRTRILVVAGIALLLALLASVGAYNFLSAKSRMAEQARLQTVGIVVAQGDIPFGSTITLEQVAVSAWPKDNYPKEYIADPKKAVGRVAIRDFFRGEPVVESKLAPLEKSTGLLSLKVPPGMRAFAVSVNEVVGVGGYIVPDSRVDVIVTLSPSSSNQQGKVSKIILEDIRVLAWGQTTVQQKDNKPTYPASVTLAVTPEDAEKLALAGNEGTIQLSLRNFADGEKVVTGGADKARLLSSYRYGAVTPATAPDPGKEGKPRRASRKTPLSVGPAGPPPGLKKPYTVDVIRGLKRTEENVEE